MLRHDLSAWQHDHAFDAGNRAGESRTWIVVAITAITMVAEIVGGWVTGSMALLADGWHMGTHVAALSVAAIAYALARRWSGDARFAFGTWKIEVLGALSSAIIMAIVGLAMAVESTIRLVNPAPIAFGVALAVAVVGLVVNIVSAYVLTGSSAGHGHDHLVGEDGGHAHVHDHAGVHDHARGDDAHDDHADRHDHAHAGQPQRDHADLHDQAHAGHAHQDRGEGHGDLNLRAAYVHVLADALTSVLAIVALSVGMLGGWPWLDPVMGIVGASVISWWSYGLFAQSSRVLLDREMDSPTASRIRGAIECDGDAEIADLHVWRVGRARYACVVTVVAREPLTPDHYRDRLAGITSLAHVSVEVNRCPHLRCP